MFMNISRQEYGRMVEKYSPNSKIFRDTLNAFWTGGLICTLGQLILNGYLALGMSKDHAAAALSMTLIALSAVLTGLGVYWRLAKLAGAGTLVPITGFANSVVAPALEFKTEGFILGTAARMFTIAGPVIVYGVSASVVYGLIYWLTTLL